MEARPDFPTWADAARRALPPACENLVLLRAVDSTNAVARRLVTTWLEDDATVRSTLFLAWTQEAGRGRRGRAWASPAGAGVYATWVQPLKPGDRLEALPLVAGAALADAANRWLAGRCRLKWPNDLVVEGRKLGGILIEVLGREAPVALIGFGVNGLLGADELPVPHATSFARELAAPPQLGALATELAEQLGRALNGLDDLPAAVARYRERSSLALGQVLTLVVGEEEIEGRFAGFDDQGCLRLATDEAERSFSAGEVIEHDPEKHDSGS
jgi:BirA family transcriptional regulator, biotin operon repressor / biotin---[acetyl-CoA-carboxylase] ligase